MTKQYKSTGLVLQLSVAIALFTGNLAQAGFCDAPVSNQVQLEDLDLMLSGDDKNGFLDLIQWGREERSKIACDLREAILNKYALVALKKARIGIDASSHLDECARTESETRDNSVLDFRDRMMKCVAAFKDTHLGLASQGGRMPPVFTGVVLEEIEGKFIIATRYEKLLQQVSTSKNLPGLMDKLTVGAVVTEINGQSPANWRDSLAQYVHGSSQAYVNRQATQNIFQRDYRYPKSKTVKFKVMHDGVEHPIEIPWWAGEAEDKIAANSHFQRVGIETLDWVNWQYSTSLYSFRSDELGVTGHKESDAIFDESKLITYVGDSGGIAMRTGEINGNGLRENFCYIQILSFLGNVVAKMGEGIGRSVSFMTPVRRLVRECESKKLPLVLDLRRNEGGYDSYPPEVLAILAESGKSYPGSVKSFATTKFAGWVIARALNDSGLVSRYLSNLPSADNLIGAYRSAIVNRTEYLPFVKARPIVEDSIVGGYNQEVVALVSPDCVSACEILVNLLKSSKRAKVVGTHSNGTGAGYMKLSGGEARWNDSYNMFSLAIPNFVVGVADSVDGPKLLDFAENERLSPENRPVESDVFYDTQVADITDKGAGWKKAALSALDDRALMAGK